MTTMVEQSQSIAATKIVLHGLDANGNKDGVNIDEQGGIQVGSGRGKPVEHRILILDNAAVPADNTAVGTADLMTYTFASADDRRNLKITFISDPSNNANGVQGASFTVNAGDDITAAGRLSLTEGDVDDRAFRIGRGNFLELKASVAITRLDLTGILPGGTPAYANDLVQVEVW